MKDKTLAALLYGLIILIALFGCDNYKPPKVDIPHYTEKPIYRFDFEDHEYIQFGENQYNSIVHDPNCKCIVEGIEIIYPDK